MNRTSILIVDDQRALRESLMDWLGEYYAVHGVGSGEECLAALERSDFDVVLLDQRLPRMSGIEVLRVVATEKPALPVIMMTAFGSVDQAVEAVKLGAEDYLLKPVDLDTLKLRIDRILSFAALTEQVKELKRKLTETTSFHNIITGDPALEEICSRIEAVAHADAAVLVTGESGTGKELVARAVHRAGDVADGPFVAIACGAIPETLIESELFGHEKGAFTGATSRRIGKFEEASNGTVFLDEIGELSPGAQVKLLRVLQERTFQRVGGAQTVQLSARVVAATNRNLEEAIETGEFRRDLFHRINTVTIDVPPLRSRRGDVPLLAQHFLELFARRYGKTPIESIDPNAMRFMQKYSWPGNVRELKGVIEQATILGKGPTLLPEALPDHLTSEKQVTGRSFHQQMHDHGRKIVLEALDEAQGVKRDAASALGLSQRALSHYLKKYAIR